jgi:hypothetical protein
VPQRGQKLRVTRADERKLDGSPLMIRNFDLATVSQATAGAALVRRQVEQWQMV